MKTQQSDNPAETTLHRILSKALEHFSNFGYSGTSVREITQAANVTKPTLYYYFKNKEELYRGLVSTCIDKMYSAFFKATQSTGTLSDRFLKLLGVYQEFCLNDVSTVKFIFLASISPARDVTNVGVNEHNTKVKVLIKGLVDDAVQKGEITSQKAACVSFVLNSILSQCLVERLTGGEIELEHIKQTLGCVATAGKE